MPMNPRFLSRCLFAIVWICLNLAIDGHAEEPSRISEFGRYEGYSQQQFDQWIVTSEYVEMRDKVRLAIDIIRPARGDRAADGKFPVIWTHSRYHRSPRVVLSHISPEPTDHINSIVDANEDLARLVRHGYIIVAVEVRGSGASFGRYEGLFSPNETRDAYEITEWLAQRPWCTGKVGMFGASYLGMTQYMAASQSPPALKAIFPCVAGLDMYDALHPGGVFREVMADHWSSMTRHLDTDWIAPKVDGDQNAELRRQAIAQHQDNFNAIEAYRKSPFRDSRFGQHSYLTHNPWPHLENINQAKIPSYHWSGWYDAFVTDAMLWFANYAGPQKLAVGFWPHGPTPDKQADAERTRLRSIEQHRWFDYWLKDIDNGIMDEAAIHYVTMDEPENMHWHTATTWPLASQHATQFFFEDGPSGSIDSVNDGQLSRTAPDQKLAQDKYQINPTTTTGSSSRWNNTVGAALMDYPDMVANDRKSLTYTSGPLKEPICLTGHPIATLYVESSEPDTDFYVLLEEVDSSGHAHYVTEGVLRASHRMLSEAPWDNLGLPYQRSNSQDKVDLPHGEPTKLIFDLHPTSTVFNVGHRIRVVVMGADADNTESPPIAPLTTIQLHRSRACPSHILLPIVH